MLSKDSRMDHQQPTIQQVRFLRGPNIYATLPVMDVALAPGQLADQPSSQFPGCIERLLGWLPGLEAHECSLGRPGGFLERVRRGTYLPHLLEHVVLELQSVVGFPVTFGRVVTDTEQVEHVVLEYAEEAPAAAAAQLGLRLVLAALHDTPFDWAAEHDQLLSLADTYRLGPSTAAIVAAARRRDIPVLRLTPTSSLVQFGYGTHQQRIQASETSRTSEIAVALCQDKSLTNHMLRTVGVPVPAGEQASSADAAWAAARELGGPVVVKPIAGNQGKGVSVNLTTEQQVRSAYAVAAAFDTDVLVEEAIQGQDYRLLVVNGAFVAAARRDPAQVVGDGARTIAELVATVNQDPRRRPGHCSVLTRITLDEAAALVLAQQGLSADSVPAAGQTVQLRSNGNLSTGGTATDVTAEVHPKNVHLAELAAQILGLDVAGIDVVCQDIRRPLREQRGAIVEVNAAPGLRMHLHPTAGQGHDVAGPIVEMLYPTGTPARIPIIAVTGTNGKTTVTRLVSHIYTTARSVVGMTCTEGTFIAGEPMLHGDCSGPRSARAVLLHPRVEVAVLETARGGILREGLAFDQCDVAVVTNITADHLGLGGVNTVAELAQVKQVVVTAVGRNGTAVLNAADPLVAEMAAVCRGDVLYWTPDARHPVIANHVAQGHRAVVVEDQMIMLIDGRQRLPLVELSRLPWTASGRIGFQVENALAAAAAAWAAGLNPALIARALTTFETDMTTVPGRFNRLDYQGIEVILDYGHNPAALQALGAAVQALEPRRTLLALTLPGDRRDDDLAAAVRATHGLAQEYVLYDTTHRRGRAVGAIPELMAGHLPPAAAAQCAPDQATALRLAWSWAAPGDRIVVIVDDTDTVLPTLEAEVQANPKVALPALAHAVGA